MSEMRHPLRLLTESGVANWFVSWMGQSGGKKWPLHFVIGEKGGAIGGRVTHKSRQHRGLVGREGTLSASFIPPASCHSLPPGQTELELWNGLLMLN